MRIVQKKEEADHLTHVAREKGATCFDEGVSKDCQGKVKNKVRSAYAIQVAENQGGHKQDEVEWKTSIEVAKIFLMMQR